MVMAAETSWPDAAIAIAGIALVGAVSVVLVWQTLETWRARMAATREAGCRRLAEDKARELRALDERVGGGGRE